MAKPAAPHNPKNGKPIGMGGKRLPVGDSNIRSDKGARGTSMKPMPDPKGH